MVMNHENIMINHAIFGLPMVTLFIVRHEPIRAIVAAKTWAQVAVAFALPVGDEVRRPIWTNIRISWEYHGKHCMKASNYFQMFPDSTWFHIEYHGYICKIITSVLVVPSTADFVKPFGCSCWGIPFSKPWSSPFEGYTPHKPEVFAIITGHIICSSDQPHINNLSAGYPGLAINDY